MSEDQKKNIEQQFLNIDKALKNKMHSADFRDYILGFIFYKYLSEKVEISANKIMCVAIVIKCERLYIK